MNTKTLTALLVLFILVIAGLFLFLNKESFFNKQTPVSISKNPPDLSLDRAFDGVTLTYNFKGEIKEIIPRQSDSFEIKLDIYSNQIPEFIVMKNSEILMFKNGKNEPATIDDLKVGTSVDIIMILDKKVWTLKTVIIQPESS